MKAKFSFVLVLMLSCKAPVISNNGYEMKKLDSLKMDSNKRQIDSAITNINDTIKIALDKNDSVSYTKYGLIKVLNCFPEFVVGRTIHPDFLYAKKDCKPCVKDNSNILGSFDGEAGKDSFYILYFYFLKHKDGDEKYEMRRSTLIEIYRTLNEINGRLKYGGTYYGHQYKRILAYSEFSIFKYISDSLQFAKKIGLSQQKQIFLSALKRDIEDEVSADDSLFDNKSKSERKKQLYKLLFKLNIFISDYFYLKMAQEFQYSMY